MMDAESMRFFVEFVVGGLLSALCIVLWFNFRSVKSEAERNREDLSNFKLHCAETYAKESAITNNFNLLFRKMEELRDEIANIGKEFRDELKTKVDK